MRNHFGLHANQREAMCGMPIISTKPTMLEPTGLWLRKWLAMLPAIPISVAIADAAITVSRIVRNMGISVVSLEHPADQAVDGIWGDEITQAALPDFCARAKQIGKPGATVFFFVNRDLTASELTNFVRQHAMLCAVEQDATLGATANRNAVAIRLPWTANQGATMPAVPLTLRAALMWGRLMLDPLEQNGVLETQELLHALGIAETAAYADPQRELSASDDQKLCELLCRRKHERYPLAYLTGQRGFMSLEFQVTPDVLIPRPETELIVETALSLFPNRPFTGLDLGTGSGCIPIAIAKYQPQSRWCAVDISATALAIAQANAQQHGVSDRIQFVHGDLWAALPVGSHCDLVVSNPPYISTTDYPNLMPEVRHEPVLALLAGDGLDFYRRILSQATSYLVPDGYLLLELGYGQMAAVVALVPPTLVVTRIIKDFAQIERVLVLRRN